MKEQQIGKFKSKRAATQAQARTHTQTQKLIGIFLGIIPLMAGCNPLDEFFKEIKRSGHIQFQNPIAEAGTGTLVGGTPKRLSYIARPESCFPSEWRDKNGLMQPTHLRQVNDTVLPKRTEIFSIGLDANLKLLGFLIAGNPVLGGGVQFKHVQRVELEFEGVVIEYMDAIALTRFYREHMLEICKDYLDEVGFIIQAIKADKMKFRFYSKTGLSIKLDLQNIGDLLDIPTGIDFEIIESVSLVINSPKYMGYQLGKLQRTDDGMALYRATRTRGDRFIFERSGLFDPDRQLNRGGGFNLATANPWRIIGGGDSEGENSGDNGGLQSNPHVNPEDLFEESLEDLVPIRGKYRRW